MSFGDDFDDFLADFFPGFPGFPARRRRRAPSDFFGDDFFKRFAEMAEKSLPESMVRERKTPDGEVKEFGPIVYGYSVTFGPDGKPEIREFGNVRRKGMVPEIDEAREPLVEKVEDAKGFKVIAEIPGVKKDDIELTVEDGRLIIDVDTQSRKYHKEMPLEAEVKAEEAQSTYNNGILEITIPKKVQERKGFKVRVE